MKKTDVKITHYNRFSSGATALAKALDIKKVRADYVILEPQHTLINWGCHSLHPHLGGAGTIINTPALIKRASNKRDFFHLVNQSPNAPRVPEWTEDVDVALGWLQAGQEVLGREKLTGKGGDGILFGSEEETFEDFLDCKLFVKYKKKKEEYRIHFMKNEVLDVQQKLLRKFDDNGTPIDRDSVDFRIRNLANGFIFARNNIQPPQDVIVQAQRAFNITELDFGCVDVIYNINEDRAYVLEINTAPGLMGTTLEKYKTGFKNLLGMR